MKYVSKVLVIVLLAVIAFALCAQASGKEQGMTVNVCDDVALWPPYVFLEESDGQSEVSGAYIEVLEAISKETGIDFKTTLLPWKRCLAEVKDYDPKKQYEMFCGGWSERRAHDYWMTAPVYFTTASYWYSREKYPNGPDIKGVKDLRKYRAIGVHGYTYSDYGYTKADISTAVGGINTNSRTLEEAFKLLSAGRGDILLLNAVVPIGLDLIGKKIIPHDVTFKRIPGAKSGGFPIYISKKSPRAMYLLSRINQAIINLTERGVIDAILLKYLPCGRHC